MGHRRAVPVEPDPVAKDALARSRLRLSLATSESYSHLATRRQTTRAGARASSLFLFGLTMPFTFCCAAVNGILGGDQTVYRQDARHLVRGEKAGQSKDTGDDLIDTRSCRSSYAECKPEANAVIR